MNRLQELETEIFEYLAPVIRFEGYELIELNLGNHKGKLFLKILLDKIGGITMGECVEMNRKISRLLDKTSFIERSYILEVSSPGADRPLHKEKEFRCAIGKELVVKTKDDRQIKGALLEVKEGRLVLGSHGEVLNFSFNEIESAKQVIK